MHANSSIFANGMNEVSERDLQRYLRPDNCVDLCDCVLCCLCFDGGFVGLTISHTRNNGDCMLYVISRSVVMWRCQRQTVFYWKLRG